MDGLRLVDLGSGTVGSGWIGVCGQAWWSGEERWDDGSFRGIDSDAPTFPRSTEWILESISRGCGTHLGPRSCQTFAILLFGYGAIPIPSRERRKIHPRLLLVTQ